jgi:very-short-patch-repair endonuclease
MRDKPRSERVDRRIASIAAQQHGVIAHWQLVELGLSSSALGRRVSSGRLQLLHRGVYAVGHARVSQRGIWMAAVLACGEGAVLSHRSAAGLWRFWRYRPGKPEVLVPRPRGDLRGVTRRSSVVPPAELTQADGIPVTTVNRTLLDLAAVVTRPELTNAFHEAEAKHLTTPHSLARALQSHPGRRGNTKVRALLADAGYGSGVTRSPLEARFTAFLRRHRLPPPDRNAQLRIGPIIIEADCVWWRQRVLVELDGREFHDTGVSFERDRERDRIAAVHGWTPIRITSRHLERSERQLARDLRALIGSA